MHNKKYIRPTFEINTFDTIRDNFISLRVLKLIVESLVLSHWKLFYIAHFDSFFTCVLKVYVKRYVNNL